jgi:hypothetical protein
VANASTPPPEGGSPRDEIAGVTVTYTGPQAEVLRTLAFLEGATPEQVALDRAARGVPLTFSAPFGEDPQVIAALEAVMFDGPHDLVERARDDLFSASGDE